MSLWSCSNLRFGYPGQLVLSCPDFTVGAGSCIRIAGPNGAGKTTLLRVMAKLLKPLSGTLTYDEVLSRGTIGYLPQRSPLQDDFPATVWEVVLSGCQTLRGWRPFFTSRETERAKAALRLFDIENLAGRSYRELSGGQRQRALLARSMAVSRKLLLLDEPTTGLDAPAVRHLQSVLVDLNKSGTAIVMITHDASFINYTETVEISREEIRHD